MPAALVQMTIDERERYMRWWIEESGLTLLELREVAGAVWGAEQGRSSSRSCLPPADPGMTRRMREQR
jgi:hypothetical protein